MVAANRRTHSPSRLAWSEGWRQWGLFVLVSCAILSWSHSALFESTLNSFIVYRIVCIHWMNQVNSCKKLQWPSHNDRTITIDIGIIFINIIWLWWTTGELSISVARWKKMLPAMFWKNLCYVTMSSAALCWSFEFHTRVPAGIEDITVAVNRVKKLCEIPTRIQCADKPTTSLVHSP